MRALLFILVAAACVAWASAERRAAIAEERARDAEAWANAVEAEAEEWMAKLEAGR